MPKSDKPNILIIWGDDIGISNLSCYSHGLMGYKTPNIDRLAREGMMFTDSYGEQSCTAGRSSFITGQSVYQGRHPRDGSIQRRAEPSWRCLLSRATGEIERKQTWPHLIRCCLLETLDLTRPQKSAGRTAQYSPPRGAGG